MAASRDFNGKFVSVNSSRVRARIVAAIGRLSPDSAEVKSLLFWAGNLLRNYAMDELTGSGAVDSGDLRAKLAFTVETSESVGAVTLYTGGKKYARIVDQGGAFTPAMRRAMFAAFRERGRARSSGKGIVKGGFYRARPYMSPAARRAKPEILAAIKRLTSETKPA